MFVDFQFMSDCQNSIIGEWGWCKSVTWNRNSSSNATSLPCHIDVANRSSHSPDYEPPCKTSEPFCTTTTASCVFRRNWDSQSAGTGTPIRWNWDSQSGGSGTLIRWKWDTNPLNWDIFCEGAPGLFSYLNARIGNPRFRLYLLRFYSLIREEDACKTITDA